MALRRFRIRTIVYSILLVSICLVNKYGLKHIQTNEIAIFMKWYFNDIFGMTGFLLILSLPLSYNNKAKKIGFHHILIFTLICGIFWEYITPLYRHDTYSDNYDILAYVLGGGIYWYVLEGKKLPGLLKKHM